MSIHFTHEQLEYIVCTRINFNDLLWAIKHVGLEKVLEDVRGAFGDTVPESNKKRWGYMLNALQAGNNLTEGRKI